MEDCCAPEMSLGPPHCLSKFPLPQLTKPGYESADWHEPAVQETIFAVFHDIFKAKFFGTLSQPFEVRPFIVNVVILGVVGSQQDWIWAGSPILDPQLFVSVQTLVWVPPIAPPEALHSLQSEHCQLILQTDFDAPQNCIIGHCVSSLALLELA